MAYIGRQLARGENKLFDDISSSFNGSTTVFNLTVSSVATSTATPYQLFVSLGGVMQKPNTDFTTAGNQITFTTAPAAGLSCWIMMQGDTIDNAAVADASITPSKISGSNFAFSGDLRLKDADGSHYVGFASPSTVASNKVWTLPAADGSNGDFLKTNGSAVLSWGSVDTSTLMPLAGGTFSGDVTFDGATAGYDIVWDKSDNALEWADNAKAKFGTGGDLEIFHNASNSVINDAGTGDLLLQVGGSTKATVSSTGFGVTGALTVSTNATITGNLTVSGTTTTINTQTLDVEDKNVVIGKVSSPSDTTADGGGWTLKGATDKTWNWVNATDAWTSSEHIHLIDNKKLFVGGASGTTDGLEIVHNASDSILNDTGTGALKLQLGGSTKLEITSGGIDVTGAINVNGSALSTAPEITGTASGSITAERGVIVNSDGTLSQASGTSASMGANVSAGTMQNSAEEYRKDTTYIGNGKIILAYVSTSDTTGKYKIGTINKSTNSVTFGSEQSFETLAVKYISTVYDPDTDRIIITYGRFSNGYVRCIVGQYSSGDSVSWGTAANVTGQNTPYSHSCYVPGSSRVAVVYTKVSNNNSATIQFGTVNGTNKTISWSSGAWNSGSKYNFKVVALGNKTQIAIMWRNATNQGYGQCFKIHANGNSLAQEGNNFITGMNLYPDLAYDTNTDSVVFAGRNGLSSDKIQAKAVKFNDGTSNSDPATTGSSVDVATDGNDNAGVSVIYNPDTLKTSIYYGKATKFKDLTIDASTMAITQGSVQSFGSGTGTGSTGIENLAGDYDTQNDRSFIFYTNLNAGNTTTGGMSIRQHGTETTATTENFIGFSSAGYSNGNTATVKVVGNTSTQSSLTPGQKYYLQADGTIGLTPLTGLSLEAGIALSSTKILIKG
jgi:hypothetical protein